MISATVDGMITYQVNAKLDLTATIEMYRRSGLRRPVEDTARMKAMLDNSNLVITAYTDDRIVGIARCLTDVGWVCYLADLAVDREFQRTGVGQELVKRVRDPNGSQCQLLLLSTAEAMDYYTKLGFAKLDNAFAIERLE